MHISPYPTLGSPAEQFLNSTEAEFTQQYGEPVISDPVPEALLAKADTLPLELMTGFREWTIEDWGLLVRARFPLDGDGGTPEHLIIHTRVPEAAAVFEYFEIMGFPLPDIDPYLITGAGPESTRRATSYARPQGLSYLEYVVDFGSDLFEVIIACEPTWTTDDDAPWEGTRAYPGSYAPEATFEVLPLGSAEARQFIP
jgi:hypothetical protein